MADLILDDFNRADQSGLGADWSVTKGGWNIDTNEGVSQDNQADNLATWVGDFLTADADYSVFGILRKDGDVGSFAVVGRKVDDENYYFATISTFANTLRLRKRVASVHTTLGTYSFSPSNGVAYEIELRFSGTTIKVFLDGVERISVTDSQFASAGDVGIWADDNVAVVESFNVQGTALVTSHIKKLGSIAIANIKKVGEVAIANIKKIGTIEN